MERIEYHPVKVKYCDICGRKIKGCHFGLRGMDIGNCCDDFWHRELELGRIRREERVTDPEDVQ